MGHPEGTGRFHYSGRGPTPTHRNSALRSLPAYVFRISLSPSTRQSVFSSKETGSGLCRRQDLLLVDGEGLGVRSPGSAKGGAFP